MPTRTNSSYMESIPNSSAIVIRSKYSVPSARYMHCIFLWASQYMISCKGTRCCFPSIRRIRYLVRSLAISPKILSKAANSASSEIGFTRYCAASTPNASKACSLEVVRNTSLLLFPMLRSSFAASIPSFFGM